MASTNHIRTPCEVCAKGNEMMRLRAFARPSQAASRETLAGSAGASIAYFTGVTAYANCVLG